METLITGVIVLAILGLAARSVIRDRKKGGCASCSGCGGSCGHCGEHH